MSRFGTMQVAFSVESFGKAAKHYLLGSGNALKTALPGAFYCVVARRMIPGVVGTVPGPIVACAVFGRPIARKRPQDGSVIENTRTAIDDGLPRGTASHLLRLGWLEAGRRGATLGIAMHDRMKHSGCCYRKAGMRKAGKTTPPANGWATRKGRKSAEQQGEPKQRWQIELPLVME